MPALDESPIDQSPVDESPIDGNDDANATPAAEDRAADDAEVVAKEKRSSFLSNRLRGSQKMNLSIIDL